MRQARTIVGGRAGSGGANADPARQGARDGRGQHSGQRPARGELQITHCRILSDNRLDGALPWSLKAECTDLVEFSHDRRLVASLFHGGSEAPVSREEGERSCAVLGAREVNEADLVVELEDGVAEIAGSCGMELCEEV